MCLCVPGIVHKTHEASLHTSQPHLDVGLPEPLTSAVSLPPPCSAGASPYICPDFISLAGPLSPHAHTGTDFGCCTAFLGVHLRAEVNVGVAPQQSVNLATLKAALLCLQGGWND